MTDRGEYTAGPLARIAELIAKYPEPWVTEKEPHDYNDGTKEFTHVRYNAKRDWAKGDEVTVEIGSHLTPDLAELLVLLRENALVAPILLAALHNMLNAEGYQAQEEAEHIARAAIAKAEGTER